jgi:SpoVK/Ycf46/Vps4 family AAA+-type ATPase
MEEYEGVTILATNYLQNFDEAFKRRMRFLIDFPFPNEDYRKEIWKKSIPEQMPTEEVDLDFLSEQFELSGSNIKNIVLHSAFLAAAEGKSVRMNHIMQAVKNEYAKQGKILTAQEAGEYYILLQ